MDQIIPPAGCLLKYSTERLKKYHSNIESKITLVAFSWFVGLIFSYMTTLTPNYVSNSSIEIFMPSISNRLVKRKFRVW